MPTRARTCNLLCHVRDTFLYAIEVSVTIFSPVTRTKKWLILVVSLTHLVESRCLFFLEATFFNDMYAADKRL